MNNFIKVFFISFIGLFFGFNFWNASNFPYTLSTKNHHIIVSTDNDNDSLKDIVISKHNDSTLDKLSKSFLWTDFSDQSDPAVYYISKFINYFLGILSFIAFLVLVYGFSMVFTGKTDEWIKKWWKYIKMAIVAIIVIWVSWLIAMWVISIYTHNVVNS